MLCHIETCEGFKTYFPREHTKLLSRSSNPKPPLKEANHFLKMTFGQLELLKNLFGEEGEAGQRRLAGVSAETVEAVLHSWRPIVKPDVEEVLPSDFPPVLEEIPWDCFEEAAAPMNEYEWMFLSLGGEAQAEGFHIQLHETVAQNDDGFDRAFT